MVLALAAMSFWAFARAQASDSPAAEQELFRAANQARATAGAPPLVWNQWLAQAAREQAQQMVAHKQLSHQFPGEPALRERLAGVGVRFDASAENVAFGTSAEDIQIGWLNSPGHRANMLNPRYNAVGIAVVLGNGSLYAVEDFAHIVPSFSSTDLENAVAATLDRMRAQDHLRPMGRVSVPRLREFACEMARQDRLNSSAVFGYLPEAHSAIAFTQSDPEKFASHLGKARSDGPYSKFAVGACFARNPTYPQGTNWVVVALF
jgi:hypothetical protein